MWHCCGFFVLRPAQTQHFDFETCTLIDNRVWETLLDEKKEKNVSFCHGFFLLLCSSLSLEKRRVTGNNISYGIPICHIWNVTANTMFFIVHTNSIWISLEYARELNWSAPQNPAKSFNISFVMCESKSRFFLFCFCVCLVPFASTFFVAVEMSSSLLNGRAHAHA